MTLSPHKVGEIRKLQTYFTDWHTNASLHERNKAILNREQLDAILRARNAGVTPKQISKAINISVYKIHTLINYTRRIHYEEQKKSHTDADDTDVYIGELI